MQTDYIISATVLVLAAVNGLVLYQITKKQPKMATAKNRVVLDSCALIDGRIVDLVKSGFVDGELYVPSFVIDELQYLADHGDAHKRERARYGLDVVKSLQEVHSKVIISEYIREEKRQVDEKLISLAQYVGGTLYTTDYNLNKVATIHQVRVLNVNELAQALRPVFLPGEEFEVKIIQKGESRNQGVGYLDDGTMAVVDNGAKYMGKRVSVKIIRMLQTEAGKMVFAELLNKEFVPSRNNTQQPARPAATIPKPPIKKALPLVKQSRPFRGRPQSKEDSLMDAINNQDNF